MPSAAPIRFYRVGEPYGELSNFAPYPIVLAGVVWPTSEHYFQAAKFPHDPELAERVRRAGGPGEAARLARRPELPPRPDWDEVRVGVMCRALDAKFSQHRRLTDLLLGTGDAPLVEHTGNDAYWGDGGDGTGANTLGRLLVDQRAALRDRLPTVQRLRAGRAGGWVLLAPDVVMPVTDPDRPVLAALAAAAAGTPAERAAAAAGRVLWVEPDPASWVQ